MTIATAAKSIMCNEYDVAIAGGVESISLTQNKHKNTYRNVSKAVLAVEPTAYIPMIETAEIVAERYNISRDAQDEYSLLSQQRTAAAQEAGIFDNEIVAKAKILDEKIQNGGPLGKLFGLVVSIKDVLCYARKI